MKYGSKEAQAQLNLCDIMYKCTVYKYKTLLEQIKSPPSTQQTLLAWLSIRHSFTGRCRVHHTNPAVSKLDIFIRPHYRNPQQPGCANIIP